ncbi:A/G-specific adenine glycosylase [uncultured Bacteroides sp.]|uniref:A/G-specific adenine glycosylase n=1 Tax=uncultured Bacteroides sp. TaxID=162156 RepID=UPI0025D3746A|nr:A/G-specific adenine glycosylase [uncultured Bacteroides sp.]
MNEFSKTIIEWYKENKRELPWRESSDPYLIWISEIILQQTRVAQGYDYFVRFIGRFPNVKALADAEEDEVMKYWQGLGYYSRARNLHAAAKSMNGVFPTTYPEVLALKGVGEYTAAAICSFAYGMPYAVVDGNVYRVLSRYFGIETPIDSTEGKKLFAALADEMLDKRHPALYNQGIMDFGAIQCTPQSPNCMFCPLAGSCLALSKGMVSKLPLKQHKTKTKNRYFNYIYVRAGAYTFINKRMGNDIWKNLFEFPLIETSAALPEEEFLALPEFRELLKSVKRSADKLMDGMPMVRSVCREVKHVLSHRVIYANFYELTLPEDTFSFGNFQKIKAEELGQYAVSRLVHAFIEKFHDSIEKIADTK